MIRGMSVKDPQRPRRTQADRSAATQERLLDAALDCLIEYGYAKTTTLLICQHAGLSRGAPQHHFATHEGLMAEAIRHLHGRIEEQRRPRVAELPDGPGRTEPALVVLWELFTGPLFTCALELWVAGRTDAALADNLKPLEHALNQISIDLGRDLFPDLRDQPFFADLLSHILSTIRGLAMLEVLQPNNNNATRHWPQTLRELLATIDRHRPNSQTA
jgi:AcrR family transcriptional regulator